MAFVEDSAGSIPLTSGEGDGLAEFGVPNIKSKEPTGILGGSSHLVI